MTKRFVSLFLLFMISFSAYAFLNSNNHHVHAQQSSDFEEIRMKWMDQLTGGDDLDLSDPDVKNRMESIDDKATDYWENMNTDPDTNRLWDDLDKSEDDHDYPYNMQASYERLKQMALAYSIEGTEYYQDKDLLDDILMGMDWIYEKKYNEDTDPIGNWWQWEIGLPLLLDDLVILLYDELSETQITHYMDTIDRFLPDPTTRLNIDLEETGANRVDKALAVILRGAIGNDGDKVSEGQEALSQVFLYSKKGDGFHSDGSFIQHDDVAYTGSYGYVLMDHLADALYLLGDSSWEVTDTNAENIYQWIKDSFEPLIYKGNMMDMVRGRAISRDSQQDNIIGSDLAAIFLRLSEIAPKEESDYIRSMVKSWIEGNDRLSDKELTLGDIANLKALQTDSSVEPKSELILHKQYPIMDRVIHRRQGFAFGISMSSDRIRNYETGNDENLKAWYTGQGMTYLYNDDLAQFNDNFWPNIDSKRLPGTTSDGQTRQGEKTNRSWAGGTSIDDLYGIAGMELDPDLKTTDGQAFKLRGKKSWFMFDDEVVALGSGITSESDHPVETIVENRKLNSDGDNQLTVNGEKEPSDLNWSKEIDNVEWAHLEGNTKNSDIGYYFPDGENVTGKRESRRNAWSAINKLEEYATYTPSTRNFLSLSIEHGTDPVDDDYSYVLLPNKNAEETEKYKDNPDIQILRHTRDVQAVQETEQNLTAANFFEHGPREADFIRSYNPASVIVKEDNGEMTISVSDPTQTQEKITLELGKIGNSVLNKDDSIKVSNKEPSTKVEIDVSESQGKSHTITFSSDSGKGNLPSRAEALKTVTKQLKEEGEFTNEDAPHTLLLHLTAISHYENQGEAKKGKKHVKNFKALLEYQLEKEWISDDAYSRLQTEADALNEQFD